jgi:hypothetical protein
MALIDKLTDLTSFDYDKVGKTNTTDGRFEVNRQEKQEGGRVESLDDLPRPNIDRNPLPPEVKGRLQAIETQADFTLSTKSVLFKAKQAGLQRFNAFDETRVYDPLNEEKNLITKQKRHISADDNRLLAGLVDDGERKSPTKFVSQDVKFTAGNDKDGNEVLLGIPRGQDDERYPSKRKRLKIEFDKDDNQITKDVSYGLKKLPDSNSKSNPDFVRFMIKDVVTNTNLQFPAYLRDITDNSSGEYNATRYIGRADQVYVYSGYSRNISISFRVAALKKEDMPMMWRKVDKLKTLVLPKYSGYVTDDNEPRPVAPFVELSLGSLFINQPGYFNSVNVTIPENSTWEIEHGFELSHLCDISLEFTFIGNKAPSLITNQYDVGKRADGSGKTYKHTKAEVEVGEIQVMQEQT